MAIAPIQGKLTTDKARATVNSLNDTTNKVEDRTATELETLATAFDFLNMKAKAAGCRAMAAAKG
jgi:hypothetical protein